MKVLCHVDNLKVSHVDPKEVNKFMECLQGVYIELMITRGKINKYLVMTLDLRTSGELWVTIIHYLKLVLEYFPEVISGRSTRPATNHLFQVRPK